MRQPQRLIESWNHERVPHHTTEAVTVLFPATVPTRQTAVLKCRPVISSSGALRRDPVFPTSGQGEEGVSAGRPSRQHVTPAEAGRRWHPTLHRGVTALAASALAAMHFFLLPNGPTVGGTGDLILLTLFVATGLGIAGLIKRMHAAEDGRETAAALSSVRAERLDAIINTTVDGIILIDARGRIETFNRGAERLFGYPESE